MQIEETCNLKPPLVHIKRTQSQGIRFKTLFKIKVTLACSTAFPVVDAEKGALALNYFTNHLTKMNNELQSHIIVLILEKYDFSSILYNGKVILVRCNLI